MDSKCRPPEVVSYHAMGVRRVVAPCSRSCRSTPGERLAFRYDTSDVVSGLSRGPVPPEAAVRPEARSALEAAPALDDSTAADDAPAAALRVREVEVRDVPDWDARSV